MVRPLLAIPTNLLLALVVVQAQPAARKRSTPEDLAKPESDQQTKPPITILAVYPASPEVIIEGVRSVLFIRVRVNTMDKQLAVPYCQEFEDGERLCYHSSRLEIRSQEGWLPVKTRYKEIVLGDRPPSIRVVAPREGRTFLYFIPKVCAVEHGDLLRLVIDAWPSEQSMKRGSQPNRITSPAFVFP